MSMWSERVEIREESGRVRAYNTSTGREITVPNFPKEGADLREWLSFMSLDAMEAFRQVYQDKWTWDDNSEENRRVLDCVADAIDSRVHQLDGNIRKMGLKPQAQQGRVTVDLARRAQAMDRRNG